VTYLRFFITAIVVRFLVRGKGFEKVRKTRIGEGGRIVDSEIVHANVGPFYEIVDGRFEQDEGHLVSDSLAHVFVSCELVIHIMLPVGNIVGCEMHSYWKC
jgi:hypothetical protein